MKRTKLMLGSLILGLGMTGAAWAQPAPRHDRDAVANRGYSDRYDQSRGRGDRDDGDQWRGDRDNVYRYNPYVQRRGDGDNDADDRGAGNRSHDNDGWRNQGNARSSWNWGHSNMRRGRIYDK
jgi:hypothetical protein